eukprot:SAG11_NODE_2106_length_3813_cov_2.317447_4_plen_195_part_00
MIALLMQCLRLWWCLRFKAHLDASDLASELLEPYNHGADGLILWGDDTEDAEYWSFIANSTGPMLKGFEDRLQACAVDKCSGHGRCTYVPIETLYACSKDNQCIPIDDAVNGSDASVGVAKNECERACGPVAKDSYRCVNGTCVPSLQGIGGMECAKMCSHGSHSHRWKHATDTTQKMCECRAPWTGSSCGIKR